MNFTGLIPGFLLALSIITLPTIATAGDEDPMVEFTPDYLADDANLEQGKAL